MYLVKTCSHICVKLFNLVLLRQTGLKGVPPKGNHAPPTSTQQSSALSLIPSACLGEGGTLHFHTKCPAASILQRFTIGWKCTKAGIPQGTTCFDIMYGIKIKCFKTSNCHWRRLSEASKKSWMRKMQTRGSRPLSVIALQGWAKWAEVATLVCFWLIGALSGSMRVEFTLSTHGFMREWGAKCVCLGNFASALEKVYARVKKKKMK